MIIEKERRKEGHFKRLSSMMLLLIKRKNPFSVFWRGGKKLVFKRKKKKI